MSKTYKNIEGEEVEWEELSESGRDYYNYIQGGYANGKDLSITDYVNSWQQGKLRRNIAGDEVYMDDLTEGEEAYYAAGGRSKLNISIDEFNENWERGQSGLDLEEDEW